MGDQTTQIFIDGRSFAVVLREPVSKEHGGRSETTHITTEVEQKRKASTVESTLETPKILH